MATSILVSQHAYQLARQRGEAPLVGLNQSSRACISQEMYVVRNTSMNWFRLYEQQSRRFPILDVEKKTIAGMSIPSLHKPVPEGKRGEIQAKLDAVMFHVMFESTPSDEAKQGKYYGFVNHVDVGHGPFLTLCSFISFVKSVPKEA